MPLYAFSVSVVQRKVKFSVGTQTRANAACFKYTAVSFERKISLLENGMDMRIDKSLFSKSAWQSAVTPFITNTTTSTK